MEDEAPYKVIVEAGRKPAFSQLSPIYPATGLTKREYFAALAMQGLCANGSENLPAYSVATIAVSMADLLLEALAKPHA